MGRNENLHKDTYFTFNLMRLAIKRIAKVRSNTLMVCIGQIFGNMGFGFLVHLEGKLIETVASNAIRVFG